MVVIKSKRSMNLSYRQMRVLEMHLFCAGSVGQPVHGHFDHLDTRVVDPRHALFVQANVIDHVGRGHGKRILQSPQRHKPVRWRARSASPDRTALVRMVTFDVMETRKHLDFIGASGRTRTCNLLIRSQKLYPIELPTPMSSRSEEHTSELQSRSDLVCRLLLEKKKQK